MFAETVVSGLYILVSLAQFRWPVLKWPPMAGIQVAAEGRNPELLEVGLDGAGALLAGERWKQEKSHR